MFVTEELSINTDQSRVSRYEALIRVSQAIAAHRDSEELFSVLRKELGSVVKFDSIGIIQYDEAGNEIAWHLAEKCKEMRDRPCEDIPREETITWWVYENQQAVVIPCVDRETRFRKALNAVKACGMLSGCAFPLTTVHRRLGVLFLGSEKADAFSEEDVSFLSLVADQIALATDDALNFTASRKAQKQLKLLLDLTNSVVSTLDLRELLRNIAADLRRVMQCDFAGVGLPDPEDSTQLRLYAVDFPESKGFIREEVLIPIEGTPPGKAFQTGEPYVAKVDDMAHMAPDSPASAEGFATGCVLPLASRGRIHGVLTLARREEKPFSPDQVQFLMQVASQIAIGVENALAYKQITELKDKLAQEKVYLEDEIRSEMNFEEIVGQSAVLKRVLKQVETVGPTVSTVMIYGETGTGKELVARALHNLSSRRASAFVKLNCAAIPTGLLESELFGHEKGAFTGAIAQRIGRFELANGGTVFLDEVGEIPLELQPKLLRVLQEREFERLGSTRTLRTDARLIAATNRDLTAMVEEQKFRSDLYYRLNVFPIRIPPLRERPEDIALLVRHFTQQFARRMNKRIESISSETMNVMCDYHWPGNIRELQNIIERAVILSTGPELRVPLSDFKTNGASAANPEGASLSGARSENRGSMQRILEETERKQIVAALEQARWVVAGPKGAAVRLGMKRSTLQVRMQKLGIARP
jgi:formate hydrogenlyase transcriptional activator